MDAHSGKDLFGMPRSQINRRAAGGKIAASIHQHPNPGSQRCRNHGLAVSVELASINV
jgi:hypothetical protein